MKKGMSLCEYKLNTLYNVLSSKVEEFLRGFPLSNLQPNALILSTRKCFFCDKEKDCYNPQRRVTVTLRADFIRLLQIKVTVKCK